jgi:hypothetical protein
MIILTNSVKTLKKYMMLRKEICNILGTKRNAFILIKGTYEKYKTSIILNCEKWNVFP